MAITSPLSVIDTGQQAVRIAGVVYRRKPGSVRSLAVLVPSAATWPVTTLPVTWTPMSPRVSRGQYFYGDVQLATGRVVSLDLPSQTALVSVEVDGKERPCRLQAYAFETVTVLGSTQQPWLGARPSLWSALRDAQTRDASSSVTVSVDCAYGTATAQLDQMIRQIGDLRPGRSACSCGAMARSCLSCILQDTARRWLDRGRHAWARLRATR